MSTQNINPTPYTPPPMQSTSRRTRTINPNRITLKQWADDEGYETVADAICELCTDSVMTALCIHGCSVEPDGRCEHDCPSPLLAAGMI